ncbi:hypothetical protein K443DRAFT_98951 [Laccaria amethystina LaAM-08-1]|uniref:Uncharacterized protein n=1 Tax=Laccaria amethystina LaAM-08-1 TaxID=1095629 RepID=A0A0C9WRL1_9AGAR|nr:hypothetical protein K443DRAFT_98951 [Laccaria amethystina LaAM-08-1]
MLVNHVPRVMRSFYSADKDLRHSQLRAAGHLTYCLFDFDLSLMLPAGKPLSDYRLSIFYCTPIIPVLAPLIDGMITRNIKARFTAAEALEFLKKIHNQLDAKVLARQPTKSSTALRNSSWDRWAVLPKDFVKQWSAYRGPPPTYYSRLLQKICDHEFGWRTVSMLRRVARNIEGLFCPFQNILLKICRYCRKV